MIPLWTDILNSKKHFPPTPLKSKIRIPKKPEPPPPPNTPTIHHISTHLETRCRATLDIPPPNTCPIYSRSRYCATLDIPTLDHITHISPGNTIKKTHIDHPRNTKPTPLKKTTPPLHYHHNTKYYTNHNTPVYIPVFTNVLTSVNTML